LKAAVLERLNSPLTVAEVGLTDLSYGQVLVRMLASGICGAQLQEIAGHKGNAKHLPHLLGHEGAGIVEAVGVGVTRVAPGDKVVCHWRKAAQGIESEFPRYRFGGAVIRSGKVTTFSERAIVSENRVTPVPADTPNELCALLGCGLSTALATIENDAALKFGESVLVIGVGGLGANLIRAARMRLASPIVAVDLRQDKAALAAEMGADQYLSSTDAAWPETLSAEGFDVIIDTTGHHGVIEQALPHLRGGGRFVMVGQPLPGQPVTIANAKHLFDGEGKSICATQGGGFVPDIAIPRYVRLYRAGLLKLDGIITDRIPLDRINDGIDLVRAGRAGRILIEM
jgi:S-(hydroxymethyl)glutathione dehydrogenase/alcohol dehydrogenase